MSVSLSVCLIEIVSTFLAFVYLTLFVCFFLCIFLSMFPLILCLFFLSFSISLSLSFSFSMSLFFLSVSLFFFFFLSGSRYLSLCPSCLLSLCLSSFSIYISLSRLDFILHWVIISSSSLNMPFFAPMVFHCVRLILRYLMEPYRFFTILLCKI